MNIFFRTRTTEEDYNFLESSPVVAWWRIHGRFTTFEEPCFIVEQQGTTFRGAFFAIPSGRTDRVDTPIRWTVVLEGGNDAEDASLFANLAVACLDISAAKSLGFELDKAFEQQEGQERLLIDSLRSWHRTRTIDVSLERGLHPLLDSWVGGTDDDQSRSHLKKEFASLCSEGEKLIACYNLIRNEDRAEKVLTSTGGFKKIGLLYKGVGRPKPIPKASEMQKQNCRMRVLAWMIKLLRRIFKNRL